MYLFCGSSLVALVDPHQISLSFAPTVKTPFFPNVSFLHHETQLMGLFTPTAANFSQTHFQDVRLAMSYAS